VLTVVAIAVVVYSRLKPDKPKSGEVVDEARVTQRAPSSFPAADEDYFHDMDGGVQLSPEEIKGRNTWIVWTAGNDRFWDEMVNASAGALDFLKILSSHPSLKFSRDERWEYFGLVNTPCFEKPTGPDPKRFGLWLDKRRADCPRNLATGKGTGFHLVTEHLAKFARRGMCARDPKRARTDGKMMGMPRRQALRLLARGAIGGVLAFHSASRANAQPGCRKEGHPCEGNQTCCPGLTCAESGREKIEGWVVIRR